MNVLDLQTEGTFEEQAAERAPLAAFHWSNVHDARSNPPLLMIRSWGRELQLYRNLARYLGPQQPIVTIAPPRGEVPLDFPRTVETWRDFCLEQMQPLLDSPSPLRIGGWSFGGVLALEVARRLETEGKQVERVVMLDTRLPKAHAEERRHARSALQMLTHHANQVALMTSRERGTYVRGRFAWQFYHARRRFVEWNARRAGRLPPILTRPDGRTSEPRDTTEMPPLQKALWVAYLKYRPEPCSIPVSQFWCAESREYVGDASLGWARILRGQLDLRPIPGGHMSMFDNPHAEDVARELMRALS